MDDLHDNANLRARIINHFNVAKDADLTARKYGVTPEQILDLVRRVVENIVTLWDAGNSLAEIRRQTGYGKTMIRNTLIRLGK